MHRGRLDTVLLGHLDYYPQFGFVPASQLGVAAPDPAWGEHFQARLLSLSWPSVSFFRAQSAQLGEPIVGHGAVGEIVEGTGVGPPGRQLHA